MKTNCSDINLASMIMNYAVSVQLVPSTTGTITKGLGGHAKYIHPRYNLSKLQVQYVQYLQSSLGTFE